MDAIGRKCFTLKANVYFILTNNVLFFVTLQLRTEQDRDGVRGQARGGWEEAEKEGRCKEMIMDSL